MAIDLREEGLDVSFRGCAELVDQRADEGRLTSIQ